MEIWIGSPSCMEEEREQTCGQRKASNSGPASDKKSQLNEESPEKCSPVRRVRLISDSDEEDSSRKVCCVLDEERVRTLEPRSGSTPSVQELDSIVIVWSQINLQEVQETEISDSVMRDNLDLVFKPSGS